jgi:hypothetical protein
MVVLQEFCGGVVYGPQQFQPANDGEYIRCLETQQAFSGRSISSDCEVSIQAMKQRIGDSVDSREQQEPLSTADASSSPKSVQGSNQLMVISDDLVIRTAIPSLFQSLMALLSLTPLSSVNINVEYAKSWTSPSALETDGSSGTVATVSFSSSDIPELDTLEALPKTGLRRATWNDRNVDRETKRKRAQSIEPAEQTEYYYDYYNYGYNPETGGSPYSYGYYGYYSYYDYSYQYYYDYFYYDDDDSAVEADDDYEETPTANWGSNMMRKLD